MKILYSEQVRELDAYTIKNEPILSINLMERAANVCTAWIINKFIDKPNAPGITGVMAWQLPECLQIMVML